MIKGHKGRYNRKLRSKTETYRIPTKRTSNQKDSGQQETVNVTHCVSPEAHEYPRTAASFLLVVNKNKKIPVKSVDTAIVSFLPPNDHRLLELLVQSTATHAIRDPGIPRIEMIV